MFYAIQQNGGLILRYRSVLKKKKKGEEKRERERKKAYSISCILIFLWSESIYPEQKHFLSNRYYLYICNFFQTLDIGNLICILFPRILRSVLMDEGKKRGKVDLIRELSSLPSSSQIPLLVSAFLLK